MSAENEALRLADVIEGGWTRDKGRQAAAELRRLYEENKKLVNMALEQARIVGIGAERELRLRAINAQPLTEDQIAQISIECAVATPSDVYFARAIERAHGIGA